MFNYTTIFCKCSVLILVTQQNALHDLCRNIPGETPSEQVLFFLSPASGTRVCRENNLKSKQVASSSVVQANM